MSSCDSKNYLKSYNERFLNPLPPSIIYKQENETVTISLFVQGVHNFFTKRKKKGELF